MFDNLLNIQPEILMIFLFQFLLIIILFIINIISANKIGKIKKKYNNFMSGSGDVNIEELLEASINKCTQKVGIIRYNAFENLGSDLSFSIALLNSNDCGLILSGIYSRDSSATYAKPIVNGKSKYALSLEEIQALDIAKKTFSENIYTS